MLNMSMRRVELRIGTSNMIHRHSYIYIPTHVHRYNTRTKESTWESPYLHTEKDIWTGPYVDEDSGAKYWWNNVTSEISWNSPSENSKEVKVDDSEWEEFVDSDSNSIYLVNKTTGESKWKEKEEDEEMIATSQEWSAYYDEESESCYWYNSATGEVSYSTPGTTVPDTEQHKTETKIKEKMEKIQTEDEEEPEWIPYVDDETGETFYWNRITNETSWTSPGTHNERDEDTHNERHEDTIDTAPHAWVAHRDDFANVYYWNYETGLSQWQRPENFDASHLESNHDIVEQHEDDEGNVYYYNTRTGESSWFAPDDVHHHQEDHEGSSWRRFDDEDGNTFYYNIHTGESSWIVPQSEEEKAETSIEETEKKNDAQNKDKEPEWIPHVDDETGQTYYWNRITGESNWEIPQNETTGQDLLSEPDEGFVTETTDGWLTEATTASHHVVAKHRKQYGNHKRTVLPFSTDEALSSGYTTEEAHRP